MADANPSGAGEGPARDEGTRRSSGGEAREHHIEVTRTARYWTLGEPERAEEAWFVLHGYKQLARRFLRRFEPIDDGRRLIVAPEALSRFYVSTERGRHGSSSVVGATWMTREEREHEIRDYVRYLDRLADAVLARMRPDVPLTVLGFSQGVATATRWAVHGRHRPARLLLWGDFTPPDLDPSTAAPALAGVDIVLVRGEEDPALAPSLADDERKRLEPIGLRWRTVTYAGGHDIEEATLRALAAQSAKAT
jgi:predicted esterase